MNAQPEQPSSLLTHALRWLVAFDRAMNSEPEDRLERRVAEFERQLAKRGEAAPSGRPQRSANAREA